jgi:hypothetical protein
MTSAVNDVHRQHWPAPGEAVPDAPAFFNLGSFLMFLSVLTTYLFSFMYRVYKDTVPDWKKYASALVIVANVLTVVLVTWEIGYGYDLRERALYAQASAETKTITNYYGGAIPPSYNTNTGVGAQNYPAANYAEIASIRSSKETAVSVFWALYSILLISIGFAKRLRGIRLFGLGLFFITAIRVFFIVWQLGPLARIISSIAFGVIALLASFLYVKYKHRLKEIIYD